ncbi:MAG: serine hydrolase [bacterium]|nr:serine hydrolase [bacterium]
MEAKNDYKLHILVGCLILLVSVLFSINKKPAGRAPSKTALVYEALDQKRPDTQAESYLVKIAGENKYLLKQREWKKFAPASLTKLLTAVIAEEELNPFEKINVSAEAKNVEAKISSVEKGEWLTKDDLLKLLLSGSANDIARVLTEEIGHQHGTKSIEGGLETFQQLAKKKVDELGMYDSSFKNPVGLDDPEHYTTAQDLVKLAEHILYRHPRLWDFSVFHEVEIYTESGKGYVMNNTNGLLKEFPAILGSKTGFTDKARDTLLMLYPVRPDKIAIVVILKSENRTEDGRKIINWLDGLKYGTRN